MKRKISVIIAAIVALVMSFSLIACDPAAGEKGVYNITFNANGGAFGTETTVVLKTTDGKLSALPQNPTKDGEFFAGYNLTADGKGDVVTLDTVYSKNTTVYAQWSATKPPVTDPTVSGALKKLVETNGYKVGLDGTLKTKANATGDAIAIDAEKRGNRIKLTQGSDEVIIDLDTGYSYEKGLDGKYSWEQQFNAGMPEYIAAQLGAEGDIDLSIVDQLFVYDAATDTYNATIDLAEQINALTAPLYAAYKATGDDGSIYGLINGYVKLFAPELTLDSMLQTALAFIDGVKDMTVDDILAAIDELQLLDAPVKEMLKEAGITDEMYDTIKTRTVGEMLTGALDYLETYMQAMVEYDPSDPNAEEPELDPNMLLATVLFSYISEEKVAQLGTRLNAYAEQLVAMIKGMSVKELIDEQAAELPVLGVAVSEEVQLTELKADIAIKLTASGELASITGDVKVSHDYEWSTESCIDKSLLTFLNDNDYHVEFTVEFSDYVATTTPFEITYEADWALPENYAAVRVMMPATGDIVVYYESGDFDLESAFAPDAPYGLLGYIDPDYSLAYVQPTSAVCTYDADTKTFTVKRAAVMELFGKDDYNSEFGVFWANKVNLDGDKFSVLYVWIYADPTQSSF